MSSLSGWSNLESFLTSTTPVVTYPYTFKSLLGAFKIPCVFGVEVKLTQDEIIYFQPTLSALSLPDCEYYEVNPPHLRPSLYEKIIELDPQSEPLVDSWISILWVPINKLPPGKLYGSILVYYKLNVDQAGYLPVHGLLTFKIPNEWVNVYNRQSIDLSLTNHWTTIKSKLVLQAQDFHKSLKTLHHDFNFILSRDTSNSIRNI